MPEILPKDWLDHHSGRIAQDCAVRLALCCAAVMPADSQLRSLVDEQIKSDALDLAFHGRRVMEACNKLDATISHDCLWPASTTAPPADNLLAAFGKIVHARSLGVKWEKADLKPNPYKGRDPFFASAIRVTSDNGETEVPIGALAASFIGSVINRLA